MEEHKKVYNKGIEYFHNAVSFSKSNRFGENITVSIISLSAEHLLSAILLKNGINSYGNGLINIIATLESNELMPTEIKADVEKISNQCVCSITKKNSHIVTEELIQALRAVKQWVDADLKHILVL